MVLKLKQSLKSVNKNWTTSYNRKALFIHKEKLYFKAQIYPICLKDNTFWRTRTPQKLKVQKSKLLLRLVYDSQTQVTVFSRQKFCVIRSAVKWSAHKLGSLKWYFISLRLDWTDKIFVGKKRIHDTNCNLQCKWLQLETINRSH